MTDPRPRVLLLGGTTEATTLAARLRDADVPTVLSFAGRTTGAGDGAAGGSVAVRVGGFGGVVGLSAFIRDDAITGVVCATHPFAARMPWNAAAACAATATPLVRLLRPPWAAEPGDRWTHVGSVAEAAEAVAARGSRRVLLTTGRQELAPFEHIDGIDFVVRSIDRPDLTRFARATALTDRGPFTLEDELALLRDRTIDTLVTKNSGGDATAPKLEAARALGITVIMVDRPVGPEVPTVGSVEGVVTWWSEWRGGRT